MHYHGKKYIFILMLSIFSFMFGFIDRAFLSFYPPITIGIANVVLLFSLSFLSFFQILWILIFKVMLSALVFGTIFGMGFWMSLSSGFLSVCVMVFLYRNSFSLICISISSSVINIFTQILILSLFIDVSIIGIFRIFFPISLLNGMLTGILVIIMEKKAGFLKDVFLCK